MISKVGLLTYNSGSSNSGTATRIARTEITKELWNGVVGICSFPSLINQAPAQTATAEKVPYSVVADGCRNYYAEKITEELGIPDSPYSNLELDPNIRKSGTFATLNFPGDNIGRSEKRNYHKLNKTAGGIRNV